MFCKNCGVKLEDNEKFCPNCGNSREQTNNQNFTAPKIQKRDLATAIILSIVTCGIYGLIWMSQMQNDMNIVADDGDTTSGGTVVLLSILTCNIYGIIWVYKTAQRLYAASQKYNKGNKNDNSVLYLLLSVFGLEFVAWCLIQNDLNEFAE